MRLSAITSTKLQITLSQAVDAVAAANFTIPGVTVNSATFRDEAKTVVTLGVTGAVAKQDYTLTATGLQINAKVQPDAQKSFTMPEISALYAPELSFGEGIDKLKADGASSTLVTYKLKDAEGTVISDVEDLEVAFTTTFGSFGEQRVAVQNGVATVMLTSEFLTVDRTAQLTATVVNAADESLIGLEAKASILMTPNPEAGGEETVGASMTDAEANQSDRVIVYFNKDVDVNDYLNATTGAIDPAKATVVVRKDAISIGTGTAVTVRGLLPVAGNSKALQILLNVEAATTNALTDNSDVWVQFVDRTQTVSVDRSLTFKNTDIRKPSMLSVTNEGLRKLVITFSEAVIKDNGNPADTSGTKDATVLGNWSIDGILLTNTAKWGAATITVGTFDLAKGEDKRNLVTIELGQGKYFASGNHSVQAANIGDWAMLTDNNNIMNTQTLDFVIPVDNDAPAATVEVQSPEQWLVTYNKDVTETATDFAKALQFQGYNATTSLWVNGYTGGVLSVNSIATAPNVADGNLDIVVTKIDGNKFLIETDLDWTVVHNTASTNKNYYNFSYRLHIPANTVTNGANGKKNAEQSLSLAGALAAPDVTSPQIDKIEKTAGSLAGSSYDVTMTEPVKLGVANAEGTSLAQGQPNIPVPTAEFIKSDNSLTIPGTVATTFSDDYDKVLTVTPNYPVNANVLPAGDWTLVIRSISDDYGNTAASVTKDFTVEGSAPVVSDFDVLWAFADVDKNWKVEDVDSTDDDGAVNGIQNGAVMAEDDDADYDYVVVKFNKTIATSGDFKNVTKTSNYTFNGQPLPTGTQILANIEGYDDLDSTIDSITIRLPQGTLQGKNAPHNLNISRNIESAEGEQIGANGGEITLAYDNYDDWNVDMANDIAADLAAKASADLAATAAATAVGTPNVANITAFVTAYNAAKATVDGLPAESLVKAQYDAYLDTLLTEVAEASDAPFMVSAKAVAADKVEITYSKNIANNTPTVTQLVFDIDGSGGTGPDTTTAITISGNRVTITLNTGGLTAGNAYATATIIYTEAATPIISTETPANNALDTQVLTGVVSGF